VRSGGVLGGGRGGRGKGEEEIKGREAGGKVEKAHPGTQQ